MSREDWLAVPDVRPGFSELFFIEEGPVPDCLAPFPLSDLKHDDELEDEEESLEALRFASSFLLSA